MSKNPAHPLHPVYDDAYSCVFRPIWVFFALFGCLDGGNLLLQFSTLGSSKIAIFKTDFF